MGRRDLGRAPGAGPVDRVQLLRRLLVVQETFLREHAGKLERFLRAFRRSVEWMLHEPQEAASLAVRRAIDGQNPELNLEIIQLRNRASVSAHTEKHGLGSLDVASLQAAADAYHRLGLISRPLDMQQLVATDLLTTTGQ